MRILFATGDVGGARAMRPVVELAAARGHNVHALWHGHLSTMPAIDGVTLHRLGADVTVASQAAADMTLIRPDVLAIATSVKDQTALCYALAARAAGVPVAHLLDNWTSYRSRLVLDGKFIEPDVYAVMDNVARDAAVVEGIAGHTIRITGTPALANLGAVTPPAPDTNSLRLVFVSEPVTLDQGADPAQPSYRGYTEVTALRLLAKAMADVADSVRIDVLPHPREDVEQLAQIWDSARGTLQGAIVAPADREQILFGAHAVVGMGSILLYEMWLRGWPVSSLQPDLRLPELRMLAGKCGLAFIEDAGRATGDLRNWLNAISTYRPPAATAIERARHQNAAEDFLAALSVLVSGHPGTET